MNVAIRSDDPGREQPCTLKNSATKNIAESRQLFRHSLFAISFRVIKGPFS